MVGGLQRKLFYEGIKKEVFMRKFLSILCIFVALFALCSCEMGHQENNITVPDPKTANFHEAPFEDLMKYSWDPMYQRNEISFIIDSLKVRDDNSFLSVPMVMRGSYGTKSNNDSELLYIISYYDENHFIFRSYREIEEVTKEIKEKYYELGYFVDSNGDFYNSKDPIEVYYVEFEKTDYAFSTEKERDGRINLGRVLEITGYWNIGPTRASKEYKRTDLNGPIFWVEGYDGKKNGDYTVTKAFVYKSDTSTFSGEIELEVNVPMYIRNQLQENKDTFDEENEGWKNSSLLGFRSTNLWNLVVHIFEKNEWPEGIVANLKEDMKQDSAGEWYIETENSIVSSEPTL